MQKTPKIYKELERLATLVPIPFYWANTDCVVVGLNKHGLNLKEALSYKELTGKSAYDFYTPETAAIVEKHSKMVMAEGKTLSFEEELIDLVTGVKRYYIAVRAPLFENTKVVGVVGSLTDVSALKEAEVLSIENEKLKVKIDEQEKFFQIANQLSHDIRSPLAAAKIWYEAIKCKLSEDERVMGRNALTRSTDILNSGFIQYKPSADDNIESLTEKKHVLLFSALEQVLAEKRLEYQDHAIVLKIQYAPSAVFAFFQVKQSAFKRMMSNLINNSVDAFDDKPGMIDLQVKADGQQITLIIEDNGKGMPESVKTKILNNIAVTSGKTYGNGIGFTQIRETLQDCDGKLSITSKIGIGTKIKLVLPQVASPDWAADCIELSSDDLVIVVDDDPSIHDAWRTRFNADAPHMLLKNFEGGEEAIQFMNSLSAAEKIKIYLLTDYELLDQSVNGLDIIEKTQVMRSILVTSHSDNEQIRERALAIKTKILPKLLASNIPIKVQIHEKINAAIEIVLIDDDAMLIDSIALFAFAHRKVDKYTNPHTFLSQMHQYSRNTLFFIDNNFGHHAIKGWDIAQQLYNWGYTHLYLLSGEDFDNSGTSIPDYLTVILKTDTERLVQLGHDLKDSAKAVVSKEKPVPINDLPQSAPQENKLMVDTLLRHLSHEIKNKLSAMSINADLIKITEKKQDVIERSENIKQSIKECTHITNMALAKLRNVMHVSAQAISKYSISATMEAALTEYPFRQDEKSLIHYKKTKHNFCYQGNIEAMKQILFHLFMQGLQVIHAEEKGALFIQCAVGDTFHELIIKNTATAQLAEPDLVDVDPFASSNSVSLEKQLSWTFCQSMMASLGGHMACRSKKAQYNEIILYFPM